MTRRTMTDHHWKCPLNAIYPSFDEHSPPAQGCELEFVAPGSTANVDSSDEHSISLLLRLGYRDAPCSYPLWRRAGTLHGSRSAAKRCQRDSRCSASSISRRVFCAGRPHTVSNRVTPRAPAPALEVFRLRKMNGQQKIHS